MRLLFDREVEKEERVDGSRPDRRDSEGERCGFPVIERSNATSTGNQTNRRTTAADRCVYSADLLNYFNDLSIDLSPYLFNFKCRCICISKYDFH